VTDVPGATSRADRGGLSARTLTATLTGLCLVGALAAAVGVERTAAFAREGRARELSLLAVAAAARMQPLAPAVRARLAEALAARAKVSARVVGVDDVDARGAPRRFRAQSRGRAVQVVTERLDGAQALVLSAPADDPRELLAALLAKVAAVLLAAGALGVAASLAVARDIAVDVRAITAHARRMLPGDADAPTDLPVQGGDEVGALVGAFNRLQRVFGAEVARHRAALAALEETERRREAWAATLRHELRTPLNAIKGFADLLRAEIDGALTAAQREDVDAIAGAGAHLLRLVDDVLDLSAIASGRYQIAREDCDVGAITREVVAEAQGIARSRGVTLTVEGAAMGTVRGDAVALRRAVTNLVINAIEHAGGAVHVAVSRRAGEVAVAVDDNGPGIAAEELRRLFRPFERGRSAEARGAGLGLAIAVALVDMHGGNLSAQSEVGRGSTFTLHLPTPEAL
jgi:signal transduction histidine kinase